MQTLDKIVDIYMKVIGIFLLGNIVYARCSVRPQPHKALRQQIFIHQME
jgi:hypothetical protein